MNGAAVEVQFARQVGHSAVCLPSTEIIEHGVGGWTLERYEWQPVGRATFDYSHPLYGRWRTLRYQTRFVLGAAATRAAEKQASRDEDARALASGEKSRAQLKAENGAFSFPRDRIRLEGQHGPR